MTSYLAGYKLFPYNDFDKGDEINERLKNTFESGNKYAKQVSRRVYGLHKRYPELKKKCLTDYGIEYVKKLENKPKKQKKPRVKKPRVKKLRVKKQKEIIPEIIQEVIPEVIPGVIPEVMKEEVVEVAPGIIEIPSIIGEDGIETPNIELSEIVIKIPKSLPKPKIYFDYIDNFFGSDLIKIWDDLYKSFKKNYIPDLFKIDFFKHDDNIKKNTESINNSKYVKYKTKYNLVLESYNKTWMSLHNYKLKKIKYLIENIKKNQITEKDVQNYIYNANEYISNTNDIMIINLLKYFNVYDGKKKIIFNKK